MRLIHAETLALHEFFGDDIPAYAILSHTWDPEEVTFQDWANMETASQKAGFAKIRGACSKTLKHGHKWVWVDTNCIDKSSSAELSEAINSMFAWYARAKVCYAYLSDVVADTDVDSESVFDQIRRSRWFTRGWTLQELLAPRELVFYDANWTRLGLQYGSLIELISQVTGIAEKHLAEPDSALSAPISEKMSWLANRTTTRVEDMAYCMLGLFGINIPLLYGEGAKAFTRLQHEIIKSSNDHTIFCWTWTSSIPRDWASLLAPSPRQFAGVKMVDTSRHSGYASPVEEISVFSMTNAGLSIRLPVLYASNSPTGSHFILLKAAPVGLASRHALATAIHVRGGKRGDVLHVARVPFPRDPLTVDNLLSYQLRPEPLLVMNNFITSGLFETAQLHRFLAMDKAPFPHSLVLTFTTPHLARHFTIYITQTFPRGAFRRDPHLISLSHDVIQDSRSVVGAAMVRTLFHPNVATTGAESDRDGEKDIGRVEYCIFVAMKRDVATGRVYAICRVFEDVSTDYESLFESSRRDVLAEECEEDRPVDAARWADIYATMDISNLVLRENHGMGFLRISRGEFVIKELPPTLAAERLTATPSGANAQAAVFTSAVYTRSAMIEKGVR
jgi:hypothetical protein